MIDVIIPAYNAHNTIGNTLLSLAKQINKDCLSVYIVDDGSTYGYDDIIKSYETLLNINVITIKNSGPGKARQVGIESSHNEYIVFIDADDYLYNEFALVNLMNTIGDADLAQGRMLEKTADGEREMEPQYCYLHGKLLRRSIIEANKLVFESTMAKVGDIYEDSTFNQLYSLCCKKINNTGELIYVYNYNQSSLTRTDRNVLRDLTSFVKAMNWLVKEINKRKIDNPHDIGWYFCIAMDHAYFNYMLCQDEPEANNIFKEMKPFKKMYVNHIEQLNSDEKLDIYKFFKEFPVIPTLTIQEFLDKID